MNINEGRTNDALIVNSRPGDVYSFNDATLGTWGVTGGGTMGTAIRVIDPSSNALIAAVSPAQVTATPVIYSPTSRHWFPTVGHAISDAATTFRSTSPGMRVSVPGMPHCPVSGKGAAPSYEPSLCSEAGALARDH
jgi:hypothetical protein